MPKFRITKTITLSLVLEVEEKDFDTVQTKVDDWEYEDQFEELEEEYSSERDSTYDIKEI